MAAAALMAASSMNVNAQSISEAKNELSISYGAGYGSALIEAFGVGLGDAIVNAGSNRKWDNEKFSGTVGIEYFRHLNNPKLAVGAIITYTNYSHDVVDKTSNAKVAERSNTYCTVMPAIKYNWINKEHFAFYSKVAAGVIYLEEKDKDLEKKKETTDEFYTFMVQVSPVGVEFGGKFRGYVELGFGEQGIALAGLRYKF